MAEHKDLTPKQTENMFVNIVDRDISEEMKSSYIDYSGVDL